MAIIYNPKENQREQRNFLIIKGKIFEFLNIGCEQIKRYIVNDIYICPKCGKSYLLNKDIYYIAANDEFLCSRDIDIFIRDRINHSQDEPFEKQNFKNIKELLNL